MTSSHLGQKPGNSVIGPRACVGVLLLFFLSCRFSTADALSSRSSAAADQAGPAALERGHLEIESDHKTSFSYGPGRFFSNFKKSRAFAAVNLGRGSVRDQKPSRAWFSRTILQARALSKTEVPVGSVAVKEMPGSAEGHFGVMVKMGSGYNPGSGDWFFELRTADGHLVQDPPSGRIAHCMGCHGTNSDQTLLRSASGLAH